MLKCFLIILGILVVSTGCSANQIDGKKEEKTVKEQTIIETKTEESLDLVEYLYSMIQEDKSGDGKSVFWDGESAAVREDKSDILDADDGGYYSETYDRYIADKLIECVYPTGFEQVYIDEAQPDKCQFKKSDDELLVSPVEYTKETALYDSDNNYIEIDSMGLREDSTKYFKKFKTYLGIKELDGVKKAGYVLILESDLADRSYKVEVYGLGNMNNIKVEALEIMNQFDVLFY